MNFNDKTRKLHRLIWAFFLMCLFVSSADAGVATLFKGNTALGQIPVMDGNGGFVISVTDAASLLGLQSSVVGEELLLSRGSDRIKIVLNAVAAWYNNQLVPLYGASYVQDGRWWLDVPSSLSLLQRFSGRGKNDRLRIEETAGGSAMELSAGAVLKPPSQSTVLEVDLPQDSQVVVVSEPLSRTENKIAALSPALSAAGEIRALRWNTSREKVRAVVDCSEGTDPEMKIAPGKVSMTFTGAVDDLQGVPSPYENVKVELIKASNAAGQNSVTLVFSAASIRVEKLLLDAPRRVVLDFVFTSSVEIKETAQPIIKEAADTTSVQNSKEVPRKNGKLLVVLDPGHGGKDPGAVANGVKEKEINLAIGLMMEKALKAKGVDVRMTRNTDVYLKLQERTEIANKTNADMFVSIHANALPPGKNSAGFEIYLMALPTDKDALALAKFENREYVEDKSNGAATDRKTELLLKILGDMQQNNKINESTVAAEVLFKTANNAGLPMKRVAQAPFFVLRGAGMPAVLLETGFVTNAREAKLLAHPGYQQKIASAMAEGIYNYLK